MTTNWHQKFMSASKIMKQTNKQTGVQKITPQEKMRLYGLYKQATQGDCKTNMPVQNLETDEKSRCQSWCKFKGISKQEAERKYVDLSRQLLNKHGGSKYIDF